MTDANAVAVRPHPLADGSATEGRKGIAYLRDHYVAAALADTLSDLSTSSS